MAANRHTCCICREPRQPVEKHHIDEDPSNNDWNNLAVVCRNCHGLVSAKGPLDARYTPGEVLRYKLEWEKRCAEAEEDDIEFPVEEINETRLIEGDSHEFYVFGMDEDDELVFSIDADGPLDVIICDEADAEAWSDGEVEGGEEEDDDDEDDRALQPAYMHLTGLSECRERSFVAPEHGSYALLLVNWDEEDTGSRSMRPSGRP